VNVRADYDRDNAPLAIATNQAASAPIITNATSMLIC